MPPNRLRLCHDNIRSENENWVLSIYRGHPLLTCNYDGADACIVSAVQDGQLVVFRCNSNNKL